MTVSVYVAGSSLEYDRVARIVGMLRSCGIDVPYDWTGHARRMNASGVGGNTAVTPEDRERHGRAQLLAVRACTDLLLLVPPPFLSATGAGVEVGVAWSAGARIHIAGPHIGEFFFDRSIDARRYDEDHEAVRALVALSWRRTP